MLAKPQIIMEQPHPRMPKSTNDLRPGRFVLQQSRGSDLVIAVGDIENISDNTHTGMKADLDLLDKTGANIGTVSDWFHCIGAASKLALCGDGDPDQRRQRPVRRKSS